MRVSIFLGSVFALVLAAAPALAAKTHFKADLEGSSVGSAGTGTGNFTYDDVAKKLCGKVTWQNLSGAATGAALKRIDNRALVKTLTPGQSPLTVNVALSDAEAQLVINSPHVYIGVATAAHPVGDGQDPNGEINGELFPDPGGVEQPCPASPDGGTDGGTDASIPTDSGATSSGGTTEDPVPEEETSDEEETEEETQPKAKADDGGCSTSGHTSGEGLALAGIVAVGLALASRRRKK